MTGRWEATHRQPQLAEDNGLLCGAGGRGIVFARGAKVVIQRAIRSIQNEMAIVAFAQMLFNLASNGGRQLAL